MISEYQSLIDQEIKDDYDHDFSLLMRYQVKVKNHINPPKIWFFKNLLLNQELFTNLYEFYVMKRSEYRDDYIKNWTDEYRKYYKKGEDDKAEG